METAKIKIVLTNAMLVRALPKSVNKKEQHEPFIEG